MLLHTIASKLNHETLLMLNTKEYYKEFGFSMLLYLIAIFFSVYYLKSNPDSSIKVLVTLLPVIPAILCALAVIRALQKLDELQLKIQILSLSISFMIVGLATFTYGFLENIGYPHIPYVWIFPFMIATWGISSKIISRQYN